MTRKKNVLAGKKKNSGILKRRTAKVFPSHSTHHHILFTSQRFFPPHRRAYLEIHWSIHTQTLKELKPHFSLGQIISASSPPGGGSLKKKMVVIAFLDKLWCGVGIETITTSHFHYLHKLIVDRSLNCCYQLCRFKTSPSITIWDYPIATKILQKGNSTNQKYKQREKKTLFSKSTDLL